MKFIVWKFTNRYQVVHCADVYRHIEAACHQTQEWVNRKGKGAFAELQFDW